MNLEQIKKAKTKKIGKQIEYYQEINSTHLYAKQIASQAKTEGRMILAERQTGGIGTKGRSWYTGKGENIATSIILKPNYKVEKMEGLTIKIAEVIQKSIYELYGYEIQIKQPNDLMLNGKKLCGILTEIATQAEKIQYLIISFGLNINEDYFSEETSKIATSLKKEYKKEFSREEILIKIIEELEKEIEW